MTRRRWIADEYTDNRAALTGSHAMHLSRVLRATVGQQFEIAIGPQVRMGRVTAVSEERVEFELGELVESFRQAQISLALAVFKFDRLEWAIEKCTELGVGRIVPVLARRTDAHLATAAAKRAERWRRISREASQQSRRVTPPAIAQPVKLRQYLSQETANQRILLAENEDQTLLRDINFGENEIVVAIGPEGGWAEEELELFRSSGWQAASLGDTILRAETAAIAGVAVISALSNRERNTKGAR